MKPWIIKPKRFTKPWLFIRLKRIFYVALGFSLGAGALYLSNIRADFNGHYSIERGYYNNVHEFRPFSCEKTKANSDAWTDGVQEFVLTTGPSISALAKHQELVDGIDADASESWHKPTVWIDYLKNHEVCVKNMGFGTDTCFDLYELGER